MAVPARFDNIPPDLRALPQWVCWRLETHDGKTTKIPYDSKAPTFKAKSNDPETWGSLIRASKVAQTNNMTGIGFMFSVTDPYCGIDLDHTRDKDTGQIDPWAAEAVAKFASYTEISPSGTGLHIIIRAAIPGGKGRKTKAGDPCGIEIYSQLRYFCFTGDHLEGTPATVEDRQEQLDTFMAEYFPVVSPAPTAATASGNGATSPNTVLDRARKYIEKMDPSVAGQRGHDRCFAAVMVLVEGFALSPAQAQPIFAAFNQRCIPPWSEREIAHKLAQADKNADPSKRGHLLRTNNIPHSDVCAVSDGAAETIRAKLWKIIQNPKMSTNERNREISLAVVAWLNNRGRFYFHAERRDFATAMFFDSTNKTLLPIQSDLFLAGLADALAMNRAERPFAFVVSAIETEALSDRATGTIPDAYWANRGGSIYLSNGPGHVVRVRAGNVELVDNGVDGVLFPYGATLPPWRLVPPLDPFESCALFRDMAASAPHGRILLLLWACALPSDQRTKPPLVLSGPIGSGKTRVLVGVFELFGIPPRVGSVTKAGESDFWAALDGGGIAGFDNADTRVDWLPDALAAASTGGTLEKRRLYTDADRVSLKSRAWCAVTSSSPTFAADAGLADRLLVVRLNRRNGETAEGQLSDEIGQHRDAGLSWIVNNLAKALADSVSITKGLNARHPDFANLAVRIGRAIGREEEAVFALRAAEADKGIFNLENDQVGAGIMDLLKGGPVEGTAAQLNELLTQMDPGFAKMTPKKLSKRLSKLWPHLQNAFSATSQRMHGGILYFTFTPRNEFFGGFGGFETAFQENSLHEIENNYFTENGTSKPPITPQLNNNELGIEKSHDDLPF